MISKRKGFAIFLFLVGLCILLSPQLLTYVEFSYINIAAIIHDFPVQKNVIGVLIIIVSFYIFFSDKKRVVCLYSNDITNEKPKISRGFFIENECKLTTTNASKETLVNALKDLQGFCAKIYDKKQIIVHSICDIPFIVQFGYLIGDATFKVKYLHYIRTKCKYKIINKIGRVGEFIQEYTDKKSDELLVMVSSSFKIEDKELNQRFLNMNKLSIKTKQIDVDSIMNEKYLNAFCDFTIKAIRENSVGISKVHLILATSSSVSLAIGQRISNSMDKEIVVYQYENSNNDNNRPWGIIINSKSNNIEDSIVLI